MRILTGIEVDILDDGGLDQEPELLERLDIVVASVHSKLSMDSAAMTRRMVRAVSNPHADVLGHCTGRLVAGNRGIRKESTFDAEAVFTACLEHGTAVEINSRPERRDPPTRLLNLALEIGCDFSIDTDAHAPGQLDFLGYGAQRALDAGVPVDRIVNTWPVDKLLARSGGRTGAAGTLNFAAPGGSVPDRLTYKAIPCTGCWGDLPGTAQTGSATCAAADAMTVCVLGDHGFVLEPQGSKGLRDVSPAGGASPGPRRDRPAHRGSAPTCRSAGARCPPPRRRPRVGQRA